MEKITVSAVPLRQLLMALNGPGHHIRELQATRGPLVGDNNPINILVNEFNQAVETHNATEAKAKADAEKIQVSTVNDAGLPLTATELFAQWLAREMPADTVIGDPAWWAPKIMDAYVWAHKTGLPSPFRPIDADDLPCLMTAEEFETCVASNAIDSDDGIGNWATATMRSPLGVFGCERPQWATHVLWFNR